MLLLECNEQVNSESEEINAEIIKLTANKLLTRLPVSLAQIKAINNSQNLINEIRQILCLLYQQEKSSKQFTKM